MTVEVVAISEAVAAAIVGPLTAGMFALLVGALKVGLRTRDEIRALKLDQAHRIGTPNGHKSVTSMLELVLTKQEDQDRQIDKLDADVALLRSHATVVDATLTSHGERIGANTTDIARLQASLPRTAGSPSED